MITGAGESWGDESEGGCSTWLGFSIATVAARVQQEDEGLRLQAAGSGASEVVEVVVGVAARLGLSPQRTIEAEGAFKSA